MKKRPCLVCRFPTDADLEYCIKYCFKYFTKYHAMNYRIRQKYGAVALQPEIPSELSAKEWAKNIIPFISRLLYKILVEAYISKVCDYVSWLECRKNRYFLLIDVTFCRIILYKNGRRLHISNSISTYRISPEYLLW